ncbi:alpha-galactosidase [Dubosiella muris]|uniref:Uncharacterized protein n=2 Tax=Dubosiella TaxID=1937008 RepID=A0AC61R5J8_9FIRM|nr:alpha-galactosidase [Dubosiella muris]TGY65269.1 hypothetical protein E5336_09595 [Dubosiella muris]
MNSWEAMYFDLNEKKLLRLAEEARALGVDCFVVDDGWFGHRDNDRSSLGDWHTDRKKFPEGLGAFARKIHAAGMQFGLWFEPEMVNEDAAFYAAHPAFVVRPPQGRYSYGRGQLVLDFANPACVDAVYAQMKTIIEQTKLDYIKWDMNRDVTEAYSPYLASQGRSQKEFYHRYIQGVYALHEKIANDFPHVLVEGCASGGGRFDAGILYYAPQIWTSDNTDAFARLDIQAGCALAYPMACMSNHISAVPNHQTFRKTSLTMREHVAVFGILGLELDLCQCAPKEKEQLKRAIAEYKAMQPLILNGTLYVHPKHEGWRAWTAIARNKATYLTGFYSTVADLRVSRNERVCVPGVEANAKYTIEGCSIDGAVLKAGGLRVPLRFNGANGEMAVLKGDFCSALTWKREKTGDEDVFKIPGWLLVGRGDERPAKRRLGRKTIRKHHGHVVSDAKGGFLRRRGA